MKIEANGIQINCEISGKEKAPVVVLSHSLACSMMMWRPQLDLLERHFQVLRFDTRGHGGSDAPAGSYTLKQLVDDAIGILDALDFDRVYWVGLSMGGMVGQALGAHHGQRLASLVLCATAAHMGQPDLWNERIATVRRDGMAVVAEADISEEVVRALDADSLRKEALIDRLVPRHLEGARRGVPAGDIDLHCVGCAPGLGYDALARCKWCLGAVRPGYWFRGSI